MTNDFKNLNEDQYKAVTHQNGPLLILAGAGSGKTHTLIHRVAYLIEQDILQTQCLRNGCKGYLDQACLHISSVGHRVEKHNT